MIEYITQNWKEILLVAAAIAKGLQTLVAGVILVLPHPPTWLLKVKLGLDDLVPNLSFPTLRATKPVIGVPIPLSPPMVMTSIKTPVPKGFMTPKLLVFTMFFTFIGSAFFACSSCASYQRAAASCDTSIQPTVALILDHPADEARAGLANLAQSVGSAKVTCNVESILHGFESGSAMGIKAPSQVRVLTAARMWVGK